MTEPISWENVGDHFFSYKTEAQNFNPTNFQWVLNVRLCWTGLRLSYLDIVSLVIRAPRDPQQKWSYQLFACFHHHQGPAKWLASKANEDVWSLSHHEQILLVTAVSEGSFQYLTFRQQTWDGCFLKFSLNFGVLTKTTPRRSSSWKIGCWKISSSTSHVKTLGILRDPRNTNAPIFCRFHLL